MSRIVAIVGRPNVGKSTLFNRLTESREAIVDAESGVTRDRHYGKAEWCGEEFSVIDTGGYTSGSDDIFENQINAQVKLAVEEANVILFLLDVKSGITDYDESVAEILRKSKKDILVVANKVDNHAIQHQSAEFYSLGLGGEVHNISSSNGNGTGDMLDALVAMLPPAPVEDDGDVPKLAIVGKPNVGKSSLINAFTNQERNIVTDISGTTRDSIHTRYNAFGFDFWLIDTAGIRKRAKVNEDIEFYSVLRSVRTIESADVCLLMIDATDGVQKQDLNIFHMIQKNKKGLVIVVNKWDLIEKETMTMKHFEDEIREKIAPFKDVPIVFTSALSKQRIHKALEVALEVKENKFRKIQTSKLNDILLAAIERYPPPAYKGKYIRIKYVTQLPTRSPCFAFFCNLPQYIRDPYKRYLENIMRNEFNFHGVPLQLFFRKK
ncbi:MAG: GTP-binding protein [Sphingobacteriales bacterium]|jgi:GTP-binding protein